MRKWRVVGIGKDSDSVFVVAHDMGISGADHPVIYFRMNIKGAWEITAAFPSASFYAYEVTNEQT